MRAVTISQFGGPDVLELRADWPRPEPGPGEALVKVSHAAVNPIDWKTRRGLGWGAEALRGKLPWVLGFDMAGTVERASAGAGLAEGARVCGAALMLERGGSYAEYAVVDAARTALVPQGVEMEVAGALPLAGLTAWQALDLAGCGAGSRVLVLGGAGGVGHVACQLARLRGAEVHATASARNQERLRRLGAEPLDYEAGGGGFPSDAYDGVVDLVGGAAGVGAVGALRPEGVLVTVPTITADEVKAAAAAAGRRAVGMVRETRREQLDALLGLVARGDLRVEVDGRYGLDELRVAHERSESGRVRGKIVIQVE